MCAAAQDINRGGAGAKGNGGPAPIKVPPGDPYMWRFDNQTPVLQGSRTTLPYFRSDYQKYGLGFGWGIKGGCISIVQASCSSCSNLRVSLAVAIMRLRHTRMIRALAAAIMGPPKTPRSASALLWLLCRSMPEIVTTARVCSVCCRASLGSRRLQVNEATAWLDASSIYGETAEKSQLIRAGASFR